MRLLNDMADDRGPTVVDPFQFLVCVASNCILAVLAIGSPFAMILSHRLLPHPFSKFASILGLALAHAVFGLPAGLLIFLFIVSLIIQDLGERGTQISILLGISFLVGTVGAASVLAVTAVLNGGTPLTYWNDLSQRLALNMVASLPPASLTVEALTEVIRFQFPFAVSAMILLSTWLSVGLAAHLGWYPRGHALSGERLRAYCWGRWLAVGFSIMMLARLAVPKEQWVLAYSGLEGVVSVLLYVQGCIVCSKILAFRGVGMRARRLVYMALTTIGFYVLVLLGAAWLLIPAGTRLLRRTNNESHFA